jgi:hypothetical protein
LFPAATAPLIYENPRIAAPEGSFTIATKQKKIRMRQPTLLSLHHHYLLRSSTSPTEIPERIKVSFLQEKKGNQDHNFSNQMG